ncbi:hypothetical protein EGW08_003332 [Elysia chlorotica]|uniref:CUB domain-containing protein n=1 Tax=Elysia chlorotica TaxID=188477 RepID=A0A433U527_ELYCH|nr:hypothetical protein EGW08_003332 [Elysia chlorotica]
MKSRTVKPVTATMFGFIPLLFIMSLDLSVPVSACLFGPMQLTAYGDPENVTYPNFEDEGYRKRIYKGTLRCGVLFNSFFTSDHVKLVFHEVNLEPPAIRDDYGTCGDKIVLYDGNTTYTPVMDTICGDRTLTVQSTGGQLLMVFTSSKSYKRDYGSFSLSYERVDKKYSSSGGFNIAWTTIAIPILAVASCLTRCAYQKCKMMAAEQEMQQVYGGYTPPAAQADPTSQQPLNPSAAYSNGHDASQVHLDVGGGGENLAVSSSAPSYDEVVQSRPGADLPPPPSYEEASSGKYDPKSVRL